MPKTKRRRSQGHSTPYGLKPGEYRLVYSHIYTYDNNCQSLGQKELETLNRNSQGLSLLFLFDLEATGLSVYTDCITEIASKVFDPPVDVKQATFSSLVHTDHSIHEIGTTPLTLLFTHTVFTVFAAKPRNHSIYMYVTKKAEHTCVNTAMYRMATIQAAFTSIL